MRANAFHHHLVTITIIAMIRIVRRTIDVIDPFDPFGVIATAYLTNLVNDDVLPRDLVSPYLRVHIVTSPFVVDVRVIAPPLVLVQDLGPLAIGSLPLWYAQRLRPPSARLRRLTNPVLAVALLHVYLHVGNGPVPITTGGPAQRPPPPRLLLALTLPRPPLPLVLIRPPSTRPRGITNPGLAVVLLHVHQHVRNDPALWPPLPLPLLMIVPCADVPKLVLIRPPSTRSRRLTNPDLAVVLLHVHQYVRNDPALWPPRPLFLLMMVPYAGVSKLVSLTVMVTLPLPNRIRTCGSAQYPPPLLLLSLPSVLL